MVQRCTNPKHERFKYYGARGVKVCERWREFKNFHADMGDPPEGLWLDRIDNNRGYEPGNCRWATPSESAQNRRQRGKVPGSRADKARKAGLTPGLVAVRLQQCWSLEDALNTPKLGSGTSLERYKASFLDK